MSGGLILAGMGSGLASAGQTMGSWMTRSIERDIDNERRRQDKEEERQFRRELQEDRQTETRLLAAGRGAAAGRSTGPDGYSEADIGEGGAAEGRIAGEMGMTVPELRSLRGFRDRGDTSPYQEKVVAGGTTTEDPKLAGENGETSDAVSRRFAKRELDYKSELPAGFDAEARAKARALSRIETAYRMGKDNQGYQAGENDRFQRGNSEAARDGQMDIGRATELNGSIDGKGQWRVQGNTKLNEATGRSSTTEVGQSVIEKNERPPAARGGSSGGSNPADKPATTADIQRQIDGAKDAIAVKLGVSKTDVNAAIGRLERRANQGDKNAGSQLDAIRPLLDEWDGARSRLAQFKAPKDRDAGKPADAAPAPAPASAKPAPKSATASVSSLPEGARQIGTSGGKPVYETPDGRRFIKQ